MKRLAGSAPSAKAFLTTLADAHAHPFRGQRAEEHPSTLHVAAGRVVFTYEPDGWPLGILTGIKAANDSFRLEHVVVFPGAPPTTLLRMLRAGVETLRTLGYSCVVFNLPHAFPKSRGLARTAARLGATRYHHDATNDFWVRFP